MTRVDLDALQRHLEANGSLDDGPEYQAVEALVAELRAAREVVDRLDPGHLNLAGNRLDPDGLRMPFYAASDALNAYLAAYPRQVQP